MGTETTCKPGTMLNMLFPPLNFSFQGADCAAIWHPPFMSRLLWQNCAGLMWDMSTVKSRYIPYGPFQASRPL